MKDKARELFLKGKKLYEIAEELNVPQTTVRQWKRRYKWDVTPTPRVTNSKKQKEKAKVLIEEGYTIKESSQMSGIPFNTLTKWSAEQKLQKNQLEYLKEFREQCREMIRANKIKRLELNAQALVVIETEIKVALSNGGMPKSLLEKLKLSEEIEQLILCEDRIEKMERLELDKAKTKQDEETGSKVMEAINKLDEKIKRDFNE